MDDSSWDDAIPNLSGQLAPIDFREFQRGGYANVYQSSWNGILVAVKVVCPVSPSLHSMRRKIRREGFIWSRLDHPNILPLLGFANDDKGFGPFGAFVSPWCSQGNSEDYLSRRGDSMSLEERLGLLRRAIEGATYLHLFDPPIVHGDIKPANILIDKYGFPKLCDFGLSSIFLSEGATGLTTTTAHTGTERYLAPELVKAVDISRPTRESDVYAMGCVGLRFIFLISPYQNRVNNFHGHIIRDILNGVPPAKFDKGMDTDHETLSLILNNTWQSNPSNRPSMSLFLSEITAFNAFPILYRDAGLLGRDRMNPVQLQGSNMVNMGVSTAQDLLYLAEEAPSLSMEEPQCSSLGQPQQWNSHSELAESNTPPAKLANRRPRIASLRTNKDRSWKDTPGFWDLLFAPKSKRLPSPPDTRPRTRTSRTSGALSSKDTERPCDFFTGANERLVSVSLSDSSDGSSELDVRMPSKEPFPFANPSLMVRVPRNNVSFRVQNRASDRPPPTDSSATQVNPPISGTKSTSRKRNFTEFNRPSRSPTEVTEQGISTTQLGSVQRQEYEDEHRDLKKQRRNPLTIELEPTGTYNQEDLGTGGSNEQSSSSF
ncbi:kinase-like protein [Serendipita vermifera]|nr:kinase-like protein [Serendipita vermifera]